MPPLTPRDRPVLRAVLVAAALAVAAPAARAQFAGVPAPPPRPPKPPAAVAAARPKSDSVSRLQRERDSLATVQRLDLQAWVDSAAPALARRPAADSARRPAPPARRPARDTLRTSARSIDPAVDRSVEAPFASVADRRGPLYLRRWPCPATYLPTLPRSV
jgi:hypothetical protein